MASFVTIVKYAVIALNTLICLLGVAVVALGTYMAMKFKNDLTLFDTGFLTVPMLVILLGVALVVTSGLACLGALLESRWCTLVVTILLALTIAGQILVFVFKEQVTLKAEQVAMKTGVLFMQKYTKDETANRTLKYVHESFECCGLHQPSDFALVNFFNLTYWHSEFSFEAVKNNQIDPQFDKKLNDDQRRMFNQALAQFNETVAGGAVPPSCCVPESSACTTALARKTGCWSKLQEYVREKAKTAVIILYVGCGVQIILFIMAVILLLQSKREAADISGTTSKASRFSSIGGR